MLNDQHIILMGFKHVGKTTLGKALAKELHLPFLDLDQAIEQHYYEEKGVHYSCREILKHCGEIFFRAYENKMLQEVLNKPRSLIALGGGAPILKENQLLLKSHCLIHITADPEIVFKRIMAKGKPAFFPEKEDAYTFFLRLWEQRETTYKQLATYTVDNTYSLEQTLQKIFKALSQNNLDI